MRKYILFLGIMLMSIISFSQDIKFSANQIKVDQLKQYKGTYGHIDMLSDVKVDSNLMVKDTTIIGSSLFLKIFMRGANADFQIPTYTDGGSFELKDKYSNLMYADSSYISLEKYIYFNNDYEANHNGIVHGNLTINGIVTMTHTAENISPDSVLSKNGNVITATAVTPLTDATGDLGNSANGMNVVYTDTIVQGGVTSIRIKVSLVDDATYSLPASKSIMGKVWTTTTTDLMIFQVSTAGVPLSLVANGSTDIADTDGKTIDLIDAGSNGNIKNRSGGTLIYNIEYAY